jgi:hypothetical protein
LVSWRGLPPLPTSPLVKEEQDTILDGDKDDNPNNGEEVNTLEEEEEEEEDTFDASTSSAMIGWRVICILSMRLIGLQSCL